MKTIAQKDLGAAKTSAYYSVAPFLGVAFSMLLLNERPGVQFNQHLPYGKRHNYTLFNQLNTECKLPPGSECVKHSFVHR